MMKKEDETRKPFNTQTHKQTNRHAHTHTRVRTRVCTPVLSKCFHCCISTILEDEMGITLEDEMWMTLEPEKVWNREGCWEKQQSEDLAAAVTSTFIKAIRKPNVTFIMHSKRRCIIEKQSDIEHTRQKKNRDCMWKSDESVCGIVRRL